MKADQRISLALLLLRLGVFLVMVMWTLDKFFNPQHGARVFAKFYFIGGLSQSAFYAIGGVELLLLLGFLVGFHKRVTYGAVLLLHGISTLASFPMYLAPFANLLYFAGWPMLAACFALYSLRDLDTQWVVAAT